MKEPGKRILEIGGGHSPFPFDTAMHTVVRVDWNPEGADLVHDLNAFPYPFRDAEFDIVFASHCIEHLTDKTRVFWEIRRILNPGGTAIIRVPHVSSPDAFNYDHVSYWRLGSLGVLANAPWYGGGTFPEFKIEQERLFWRIRHPVRPGGTWAERFCAPHALQEGSSRYGWLDRVFNRFLATHKWFSERYLYYWIGGIDEIEYILHPCGGGPNRGGEDSPASS